MGEAVGLRDYRVLSFDCYGTLIDWESGILTHLRPWLGDRGIEASDEEILQAYGRAEASQETETPDAPYPQILSAVHERLTGHWGIDPDASAAAEFAGSVGRWPSFADSSAALTELKQRYRLVILSNVDRASFAQSEQRLGTRFDAVYTAEDIGSYKPDPANFQYLLEAEQASGYRREDIIHVGQSLYHDHVPAAAAGLATCWIQRSSPAGEHGAARPPGGEARVDYHFRSLAELVEAVEGG
jgi:2-haloalkanoic acid dehalogenase type II